QFGIREDRYFRTGCRTELDGQCSTIEGIPVPNEDHGIPTEPYLTSFQFLDQRIEEPVVGSDPIDESHVRDRQPMIKLLLASFVCLAHGALPTVLLQPIGQEPFHRASPRRIELDGPIRVRPDPDSCMWLAIQTSGLIQEFTKGGGTAGSHELKRDGLLQRRIQTDQLAPVVGEETSAFLYCFLAHQGLRQGSQGGQKTS